MEGSPRVRLHRPGAVPVRGRGPAPVRDRSDQPRSTDHGASGGARPPRAPRGSATARTQVARFRPRAVAVLGVGAYCVGFSRPGAAVGAQGDPIGGSGLGPPQPQRSHRRVPAPQLIEAFKASARRCRELRGGLQLGEVPEHLVGVGGGVPDPVRLSDDALRIDQVRPALGARGLGFLWGPLRLVRLAHRRVDVGEEAVRETEPLGEGAVLLGGSKETPSRTAFASSNSGFGHGTPAPLSFSRGVGLDVPPQDDPPAAQVGHADGLAVVIRQGEVGAGIPREACGSLRLSPCWSSPNGPRTSCPARSRRRDDSTPTRSSGWPAPAAEWRPCCPRAPSPTTGRPRPARSPSTSRARPRGAGGRRGAARPPGAPASGSTPNVRGEH